MSNRPFLSSSAPSARFSKSTNMAVMSSLRRECSTVIALPVMRTGRREMLTRRRWGREWHAAGEQVAELLGGPLVERAAVGPALLAEDLEHVDDQRGVCDVHQGRLLHVEHPD